MVREYTLQRLQPMELHTVSTASEDDAATTWKAYNGECTLSDQERLHSLQYFSTGGATSPTASEEGGPLQDCWEDQQRIVLNVAADRGDHTDQSQSLSIT